MLQPDAPAAASLHGTPHPEEAEDADLNKALGVERFQQILSPTAVVPDHKYHDEDIECTQRSILGAHYKHVHHNLLHKYFVRLYLCRPPPLLSPHPPTSVQTALRGTQEKEQ